MWRRMTVLVVVGVVGVVGCGDDGTAGESDDAAPTTGSGAEGDAGVVDAETARSLVDEVVLTGSVAGLEEDPQYTSDEWDRPHEVCGEPLPHDPVAFQERTFNSDEMVQSGADATATIWVYTYVYRSADAAGKVFEARHDARAACDERENGDEPEDSDEEQADRQVSGPWEPMPLPGQVSVDGWAMKTVMVIEPEGVARFPRRDACLRRGPVIQCMVSYSGTEQAADQALEEVLAASQAVLTQAGI